MLIVTGIVEVGEGSLDVIKANAQKMAEATRTEAGCRTYAFYQDIEAPTRFRIYEEWDDQAALTAHFQTPHMAEFNASLAGLEIKAVEVVKFEPGEIKPVNA